ncbi:MAG: 50S ribosomal protein L19 [Patescibacteria group bacterium]
MIQAINFVPGDTVRVSEKVKEVDPSTGSTSPSTMSSGSNGSLQASSGQVKTRLQVFEGVVLGIKGRGENKSFSVMKTVGGIGVEKIFPVKSPNVEKVEVKSHSKTRVRRAKLYYKRIPRTNP